MEHDPIEPAGLSPGHGRGGRRDYRTPVLDRLAAEGLLLTQGHATERLRRSSEPKADPSSRACGRDPGDEGTSTSTPNLAHRDGGSLEKFAEMVRDMDASIGRVLEGGIRVPLIVRWPAAIRAGSRSDQVMASMDWLPTLAAAAGAERATSSDGENLLEILRGTAPPRPRRLFWRFRHRPPPATATGSVCGLASRSIFSMLPEIATRGRTSRRAGRRCSRA